MNDKKRIIDPEDLRVLGKIIRKNWYFLLFIPLFFYVVSLFYVHRLTSVYGAKVELLLKSNETYDYQNQLYSGLGYYGMYSDITNQKRVLLSHDLISQAIDKLDFEVSYFIVGRIKVTEVYRGLPFIVEMQMIDPAFVGKRFDFWIIDKGHFRIKYLSEEEEIIKDYAFNKEYLESDFKIKVVRAREFTDKRLKDLTQINYQFVVNSRSSLVNKYRGAISIDNPEYTTVLEVKVEDEIVGRAKIFLDTLSKVYLDYSLKSEYKINERTLVYIDKQLAEITLVLDSIENDLENYKMENAILDLDREEIEYFNKLIEFDSKKRELDLSLNSINSLRKYLQNLNDERLLPPSFYVLDNDMFLKALLNELYSDQIKFNELATSNTFENHKIKRLEEKLGLTNENILTYLKNTEIAIYDQLDGVGKQIRSYEAIIKGIPKSQRDILNIERKRQVNENLFIFLLEKRANTNIARAGIVPQSKVINSARSIGLIRPNKEKVYFSFLFTGVAIAVLLASIRFILFDRIEDIKELTNVSRYPVIGGLPYENNGNFLVNNSMKSSMAESFRSIRTNLEYLCPDKERKIVLISSVHPGEGKTHTSSNLAFMIAKSGKKVLLVDFDLHKPKIHQRFSLENTKGVSSIFSGSKNLQEVVYKHEQLPELNILLAGPVPPNPSELISSHATAKLFSEIKEEYDYLIIDTPPLALISDAQSLMKYADVSLFVLNTKFANKKGVLFIENVIKKSGIESGGLILNGIKPKVGTYFLKKYGYGYDYGYGYGYGYGNDAKENDSSKKETEAPLIRRND